MEGRDLGKLKERYIRMKHKPDNTFFRGRFVGYAECLFNMGKISGEEFVWCSDIAMGIESKPENAIPELVAV